MQKSSKFTPEFPVLSIDADGMVRVPAEKYMTVLARIAMAYRALGMRPIQGVAGGFCCGALSSKPDAALDLLRAIGALLDMGVPEAVSDAEWASIMKTVSWILTEVSKQIRRGVDAHARAHEAA